MQSGDNQAQFLGQSFETPEARIWGPPDFVPKLTSYGTWGENSTLRRFARAKGQRDRLRTMSAPAVACAGLSRRFGAFTAVDNLSLRIAQGQFFGFLGPNGAGKSTPIRMLTGLLEPSSGQVEFLGKKFSAGSIELKRQIGVVPEGMALVGRLTAPEY